VRFGVWTELNAEGCSEKAKAAAVTAEGGEVEDARGGRKSRDREADVVGEVRGGGGWVEEVHRGCFSELVEVSGVSEEKRYRGK
jgi:hypothetical protein